MNKLPLTQVRVIDLTMGIAGPTAAHILADLGAQVIKVEAPIRYDVTRMPGRDRTGLAVWARELGRNKLAIALDLTKPFGVDVFKRLVAKSDVVIESYTPRVMPQFGLDYEVLKKVNPKIIMISMSGFGATGPYRNYLGNGGVVYAASGLTALSGYKDGPPIGMGGAYPDIATGVNGALAVLAALYSRRRNEVGQHIDAPMREAMTQLVGVSLMEYMVNKRVIPRMGNDHPFIAPHGCYRCKGSDAWVTIAAASDEEWDRLVEVMGNPTWSQEDKFRDALSRWQHREQLDHLIEEWTKQHDRFEIQRKLQEVGVAAGAVLTAQDLINDEHLQQRGYFQVPDLASDTESSAEDDLFSREKNAPFSRQPWISSRFSWRTPSPSPSFAQHNDHVFREILGLSDEEVTKLYSEGVTSDAPGENTRKT